MLRSLALLAVAIVIVPSAAADKRAPVHVGYDLEHLDLDKRVLEFRPSRPIREASIVAIAEDGTELGRGAASYERPPAGAWWSITWSQPPDTRVLMLKLRVAAADGVATNVDLVPWSVTIEHDDVKFATDSAAIEGDEGAKLDASLAKIQDVAKLAGNFMKLTLYVAGHTDTVGTAARNRKLSLDRAMAIARYFRGKKLAMPIVVAGFGEDVPRVKTPDETDEPRNRRADYVIGPQGGAPPFKGAYTKAKAEWKPVR